MKLISGSANLPLAQGVAAYLDAPLCESTIRRFADDEIFVSIGCNVRGEDVFVIQPTSNPANDNLMELLITIDALKRSSVKSVTAVIPYFGYARQDRKTGGRSPISAKLVANLITKSGVDRVLTVDFHSGQIAGFFDIPVDNLHGHVVISDDIVRHYQRPLIVSPDIGGVVRARALANRIGADLAIVDKRRSEAGKSEVMNIIGDVKGRNCVLFDDMADSCGTLANAADALMKAGANMVSAYVTHGVLSGEASTRVLQSELHELVITDSIVQPLPEGYTPERYTTYLEACRIRKVTVAPLIGEAIRRIYNGESVSKLFA